MTKKQIPVFKSDKEAERFVETADLSEFDLSGFTRVQLKIERTLSRRRDLPSAKPRPA
jgi:hypothetical protein